MNKLYVVGIGPGAAEDMTLRAMKALRESEVIAGYGVYVELVKPLFPDKEYLVTPMRQEVERCRLALDRACSGKTTAMRHFTVCRVKLFLEFHNSMIAPTVIILQDFRLL